MYCITPSKYNSYWPLPSYGWKLKLLEVQQEKNSVFCTQSVCSVSWSSTELTFTIFSVYRFLLKIQPHRELRSVFRGSDPTQSMSFQFVAWRKMEWATGVTGVKRKLGSPLKIVSNIWKEVTAFQNMWMFSSLQLFGYTYNKAFLS